MSRKQIQTLCRILAGAALLLAAVLIPARRILRLLLFLVPYLLAGGDVLWRALRNILRGPGVALHERAALGADEHVVVYLFAAVITFLHEAYSLYNILKYPASIVPAFVRKVKYTESGAREAHFLQGIEQFFAFTWREISI